MDHKDLDPLLDIMNAIERDELKERVPAPQMDEEELSDFADEPVRPRDYWERFGL